MASKALTAAELDEVAGLVDGQAAARSGIATTTAAAVAALWAEFGGWYSTDEVGKLTGQVLGLVRASKRQTASLTNAYVTRTIAQVSGGRRRPAARLVDVDALRLDPFTGKAMSPPQLQHAYGRPADQYRYLRSQRALELERLLAQRDLDERAEQRLAGLRAKHSVEQLRDTRALEFDDTEFVQQALERARAVTDSELLLAQRFQARKTGQDDGRVQAWRRVLHPELSGKSGVCGLCVAASDRVYYIDDLQPIHAGCHCEPMPVVNGRDPGQNLNAADLDALYKIAGSTYAADLLRVRVKVTQHGEIGPVLQQFNANPKLAPEVRRQTARQRRPGSGDGTPAQEDEQQ